MSEMTRPTANFSVARRSLGHFAAGRIASAAVGICTLLLLVRVLDKGDYGFYITLFAAFEILQLASSPGAYAVAFRYLPEIRLKGSGQDLTRMVVGLSLYRLVTIGATAVACAWCAEAIVAWLGAPQHALVLRLFALVLVFEGLARFIDVQFESLLLQGLAQASALARNGAKLAALLALTQAGTQEVSILAWIGFEAVTSAMGVLVSCGLMWRHLHSQRARVRSESGGIAFSRIWRFALPSYVSHAVYIASGTEMVKLLVSKLIGTAVTAAFGFAAAVAATLQRYLPSYLLIGWIRPLLISAREQGKSDAVLVGLALTILKLNLLFIMPLASLIAVAGPELVQLLAGGRMPESAPFLAFFLALLVFQSVRAVVSLLGLTLELGGASMTATLLSVLGLAGGVLLFPSLGAWGLCAGLVVSEILWSASMVTSLSRKGLRFVLPYLSIGKCLLCAVLGAGAAHLLLLVLNVEGAMVTLAAGLLSVVLCLVAGMLLKPFDQDERNLINRLLPMRLFVW